MQTHILGIVHKKKIAIYYLKRRRLSCKVSGRYYSIAHSCAQGLREKHTELQYIEILELSSHVIRSRETLSSSKHSSPL